MQKHFNTAGPNIVALHYQIDPLTRIELSNVLDLIAQQRYFVLHAPRQTGKTTCLLALRDYLNRHDDYAALYVNIEGAQAARGDVAAGVRAVIASIGSQARRLFGLDGFDRSIPEILAVRGPQAALTEVLGRLSVALEKPLVLFLDEVDALIGDTLISLLRQIRAGYTDRPQQFPQTIVLCGVRDVRDYRMTMADGEVITGGSAFNIKAESLRLGDFSRDEMTGLYQQHTDATGQIFTEQAIELAWLSTQGQPWLVNALAEQAVWKTKENLDRTIAIDLEKMRAAREALILRNDTHLDQLADKLREPRVRAVIEPMLMGDELQATDADIQYVLDLGLVRRVMPGKSFAPANQIYAEVLPRVLNNTVQYNLHEDRILASWQNAAGRLDPRQFLANFLDFWREHGEQMMRSVPYHEASPHLVLMAYLQRVINGGGRIEREYAAGSGRLDLLVIVDDQRMAIEVKVWRSGRKDPLIEGLAQMQRYLQRLDLAQGYLVIFDQRAEAAIWDERMQIAHAQTSDAKDVMVLRA
jgi:hypothetical protein